MSSILSYSSYPVLSVLSYQVHPLLQLPFLFSPFWLVLYILSSSISLILFHQAFRSLSVLSCLINPILSYQSYPIWSCLIPPFLSFQSYPVIFDLSCHIRPICPVLSLDQIFMIFSFIRKFILLFLSKTKFFFCHDTRLRTPSNR